MAENRKERGPARYYFTRGQLVLLGTGFTLTSVVIFLIGILVGQRIEENKVLKKNEPPLAKIPAQAQRPAATQGAAPKDEMTFYDTLAKGSVKPKASRKGGSDTGPAQASAEEKVKQKKSVSKAETALVAEKMEVKGASLQGQWAVQVNAFPHERDAKDLAKKLSERGYDAYVVPVEIKGRPWYRVRVGRLATREEAKDLQETMKTKENLTEAIAVTR